MRKRPVMSDEQGSVSRWRALDNALNLIRQSEVSKEQGHHQGGAKRLRKAGRSYRQIAAHLDAEGHRPVPAEAGTRRRLPGS
jgi:hypothetical protein